jgi:hypothetical protein
MTIRVSLPDDWLPVIMAEVTDPVEIAQATR